MIKETQLYYDKLSVIASPELMELITLVEEAFDKLNYSAHIDGLNSIFLMRYDNSESILACTDKYTQQYVFLLNKFGVAVNNSSNTSFATFTKIFLAVAVLASSKIYDVVEGMELNPTDSNVEYLAQVLCFIDDELIVQDVLLLVTDVKDFVIEYIESSIVEEATLITDNPQIKERFKKYLSSDKIQYNSIVIQYIRQAQTFGYSPETGYLAVKDEMHDVLDNGVFASEICLLVAGSNAKDKELIFEAVKITDIAMADSVRKIAIISIINIILKDSSNG